MAGHGVAGAKVPDWRIAMTEMTDMAKAWSAVVAEKNAEIARLRAQRDNREMLFEMAKKDVEKLIAQRDQLLAALKFYADEENWREEGSVLHFGSQVRADEGEIARDAIAAVEEKP
jgi:hypothetical protein